MNVVVNSSVDMNVNDYVRCESSQLQAKDTTICKLKERIKSLSIKDSGKRIKKDIEEIETINIELEQTKSLENSDLNAQLHEKVFAIAALKNELRKIRGKDVVESVISKLVATTIVPGMYKLDLEALNPRLLKNREAHKEYIKHTLNQADTLRDIVEQAKAVKPLDNSLEYACKYTKHIQLLVYVRDTCPNNKPSKKLLAVMPMNKLKKVRFFNLSHPQATSNRHTRRILETIHVDFDELTAMASEQSSSGPTLHEMTRSKSSFFSTICTTIKE
ncbi:hypothetical protein Tco_1048676 [Tanacetum coccineum]